MAPMEGVRAVEDSLGASAGGAGMGSSLPGMLLRDIGADVTRVQSQRRSTLDAGVESARPWDRGKEIVEADNAEPARAAGTTPAIARDPDVLFLAGGKELAERRRRCYRR